MISVASWATISTNRGLCSIFANRRGRLVRTWYW